MNRGSRRALVCLMLTGLIAPSRCGKHREGRTREQGMNRDSLARTPIAIVLLLALSSSWLPSVAHATHFLSVPASLCVQEGGDWKVVGQADGGDVYACVARHTSPAPTPTITPVSVPVPSSVGTIPKPTLSPVPLPVITVNGVNDESRYRLHIQIAGIAQSYPFTDRRRSRCACGS